jgi:hypothetical protein
VFHAHGVPDDDARLARVVDAVVWREGMPSPEWLEVDLGRRVRLCRIDLLLGEHLARAGKHLAVWVAAGRGVACRRPCTAHSKLPNRTATTDRCRCS